MTTNQYRVAGHVFELTLPEGDTLAGQLSQYEPFRIEKTDEEPVFRLQVLTERPQTGDFIQEIHQDDDGSEIRAGRVDDKPCFDFLLFHYWQARLLTDNDYREGTLYAEGERLFGLNNALMVMFALSTARLQTLLFHASVVSRQGAAYLMLGKSGTGKSTHTRLWLEHIDGTELVNDDNPVVRIVDEQAMVYGSPWSGKTPCYRNVSYPVGAFVQLSQAPVNEIRRMRGLEAYASLMASVSGKRWDRHIADGLHQAQNWLAGHAPVFHLRCLPDRDAAMTCLHAVAPQVEAAPSADAATKQAPLSSRHKTVDNNEAIAQVAALLKEGHKVILPVKGQSMLPFIVGNRDSAELAVPRQPLAVGDAVLAWVEDCRYVLHRIVAIDGRRLVLMGDGNLVGVEHCSVDDVVARAEYVVKPNGSRTYLYSDGQRKRWQWWMKLKPVRRWILAIYRRVV